MRMIEIAPLNNGAHRNQSYNGNLPFGWAIVPADLATENFPFGEVEVEVVAGVPTVTRWTPIETPAPVVEEPSPAEQREAAYNTEDIIEWDGEMITVTQAAQLWQYYAAEGSDKATALTVLIAEAKQIIREKYPDAEVLSDGN